MNSQGNVQREITSDYLVNYAKENVHADNSESESFLRGIYSHPKRLCDVHTR